MLKKYDHVMMDTAINFSKLSTCKKMSVGTVIFKDGRILVTGYNGTFTGKDNNCEDEIFMCTHCNKEVPGYSVGESHCIKGHVFKKLKTNINVTHAERNAIFYAAKKGISLEGSSISITHSPCSGCAAAIISSGIVRVIYLNEYKDNDGLKLLKANGILIDKL